MYILCLGIALAGLMFAAMVCSQYKSLKFFFWFFFSGLLFSAALIFLGLTEVNGGHWIL